MLKLIIAALLFATSANATECVKNKSFWKNETRGRGWFWKELPCVEDNRTYKFIDEQTSIPWDIIEKLDPDEIAQKIEPETRKVAVTYPTHENLSEYRKLTLWMTDRSLRYANADQMARTNDPALMPYKVNAKTSAWAENIIYEEIAEKTAGYLTKYRDTAGLLILTSPNCTYCAKQIPILEMFSEQYGWEYITRDITETPLKVEMTPDIFLVMKTEGGNTKHQRIATGLTTLSDLVNAVMRGLSYMGENIDEKVMY